MAAVAQRLVDLALVTAAYALVDLAVRREGVPRGLKRLGLGGEAASAGAVFAVGAALAPLWGWEAVPQGEALRGLGVALGAAMTWKAATRDVDVVLGERRRVARWSLVASAAASWWSPSMLWVNALLLTTPFGLWQHHATLPMRLLQALLGFAALGPALAPWPVLDSGAGLVSFLVIVQASHYLITALAKGWLGPRWYSWVFDNRLHHLAASAYSWGWARFVPWSRWRRVIGAVKRAERPLQLAAFAVELLAPLALLDARIAMGLSATWAAFHVGVFALSGLLFWDWIVANLALLLTLLALPGEVTAQAFGAGPALLGLAWLVAFPLRHRLWRPMPLGWWDSPFTQRMHWIAEGVSGARYGIYNDLMCPHERLYGKVHGCFLAPHPVCTYHLGEVYKHELRDALRAAGPDLARLDAVRERFGILPRSPGLEARHRAYLRRFFHALNEGAPKRVLPRWLRWLKAPGGQVFYWGELPAYRGQEPVARVSLRYREEYFDGEVLRRLRDEEIATVEVGPDPADAPRVREPTPKELDDFLLGFARGRLIDLPEIGGGYVRTDDGRAR